MRGFGLLLVAGIAVAFLCALTAGSAVLILGERDGGWLGASWRGAGEILRPARPRGLAPASGRRLVAAARGPRAATAAATPGRIVTGLVARPGRVLALAAVLAVIGWVADTQTAVQSDVTKLVPTSMPALRNLDTLEKVTGVSGEIDVTVRGKNVATPATVQWMISYERQLLSHFGYLEEKGLRRGHAVPGPVAARPVLQRRPVELQRAPDASLTQAQIAAFLAAVPSYFSQAVITPDHREATLAFGIRLMPLSRQERVIDYMRSHLHPPAGTTAALAGLPVLAAEANASLSSTWHRFLTLIAGLLAVALVLLAVLRRPRPRARAAGPDRHGHRLVGADPVPDRDPAEPDVGHARDARHRHLDRVQRAALRALPPGAGGRARPARGAAPDLPLHRRRRAGLRGDRDRRASACWSSRTSRCCATSGS